MRTRLYAVIPDIISMSFCWRIYIVTNGFAIHRLPPHDYACWDDFGNVSAFTASGQTQIMCVSEQTCSIIMETRLVGVPLFWICPYFDAALRSSSPLFRWRTVYFVQYKNFNKFLSNIMRTSYPVMAPDLSDTGHIMTRCNSNLPFCL